MKKAITYTLIILTTLSCYKNNDSTVEVKIVYPPKVIVTSKLSGDVVTPGPPADYSLKVNRETYDVLDNKLPLIDLSRADRRGQYIELVKEGVVVGAYHSPIIENTINHIQFKIGSMPEEIIVSPNQSVQLLESVRLGLETVTISDGAGNEIKDDFSLYYLHQEDPEINTQLVSQAYDGVGDQVVISPYSSMQFQALDKNKNTLSIENGQATLSIESPQDGHLMGFDRNVNEWVWISEITAGTNEVSIPSFGWYIIGALSPAVKIEGNVLSDNKSLSYQHLRFESNEFTKKTYSSLDGRYLLYAPQNATMEIHASDPCDNIVDSSERTTNSNPELVTDISLSSIESVLIDDEVSFLDCDGNIIEDAIIDLQFQGHNISYGIFSGQAFSIPVCSEKYSIAARTENEIGPSINWDENRGSLHYLSTCPSHENGYAFIKVRNDKQVYPGFTRMENGGRIEWTTTSGKFQVVMPGDIGSYSSRDINIKIEDAGFGSEGYFLSCLESDEGCGISTGDVTHSLDNGDGWDRIYLSGDVWMRTISPPRVGNFQVEGMILVR